MRQTLILLSLFLSFLIQGQPRTKGIINDPDGYTNIRAGKGTNFEIVGKILFRGVRSKDLTPPD